MHISGINALIWFDIIRKVGYCAETKSNQSISAKEETYIRDYLIFVYVPKILFD